MLRGTFQAKLDEGGSKLQQVFDLARPALQLGGVSATDPRFAEVAVNAGVRVLEPNHTAVSCARARKGLVSMREAYAYKHELEFEVVLEVVRALRRVVPQSVFILCAAPGTFDEVEPSFTERHGHMLSEAGADGLFVEKDSYAEIERLVGIGHRAGLLAQAAFQLGHPGMKTAVVPIHSPTEASGASRRLADMGVDIVGMRLSGIFQSLSAGEVAREEVDCIRGLVDEVKGATVVYAGVNAANWSAIAKTGVKMVGLASGVDDVVYHALSDAIAEYQGSRETRHAG